MREILRTGLYQALHLNSVPEYAAVSVAVALARKRTTAGATRFVNGVLRSVLRIPNPEELFPSWQDDPVGHLSTSGSHPRWLVARWCARWGAETARDLVTVANRRPPTCLVPLDGDLERAGNRLAGLVPPRDGIAGTPRSRPEPEQARHPDPTLFGCVPLPAGVAPDAALEAVGDAVIQGPGAHSAVRYADLPADGRIVDLCAAPGGKALVLAAGGGRVVALDRSPSRLQLVAAGARRLGLEVRCAVADARRPPLNRSPAVLLDAPCTGTATFARNPDLRWRLRPDAPARMAALQADFLAAAARAVTLGGLLVYSTCTLEPEENELQVAAFLTKHPDFRLEPPAHEAARQAPESHLLVRPDQTGVDGAFAARFRRRP